jgi:hypothetical protein
MPILLLFTFGLLKLKETRRKKGSTNVGEIDFRLLSKLKQLNLLVKIMCSRLNDFKESEEIKEENV